MKKYHLYKRKKCKQYKRKVKKVYCIITKKPSKFEIKNTDELLSLMEIYLAEWSQRDNLFWKQTFTYFFASLVVMLLPFMSPWDLELSTILPLWLFPLAGILLSIAFFIVMRGYLLRLKIVGEKYADLISMLPEEFQRKRLSETNMLLARPMGSLISYIMLVSLLAVGSFLFFVTVL